MTLKDGGVPACEFLLFRNWGGLNTPSPTVVTLAIFRTPYYSRARSPVTLPQDKNSSTHKFLLNQNDKIQLV